jgi:hypothetical protein
MTPEELQILKAITCRDVETFLPGGPKRVPGPSVRRARGGASSNGTLALDRAPSGRREESGGRPLQAEVSRGGRQVHGPRARGAPNARRVRGSETAVHRGLARCVLRDIFGYARCAPAPPLPRCHQGPSAPARAGDPPVLDVHPTAYRPDPLPGYAWLQLPDRIREVHCQWLEFWYDPPGCALTDEELDLLRRIGAAEEPVMFQAEGRTIAAQVAFDHRVDVLRDLRKAGWIVLEVWVAEPGTAGTHAGAIRQFRPSVRRRGARRSS